MSSVKFMPSKSSAVSVPATEFRPPIMLDDPNCSKSMFAVEPLWSIYISLSAAYRGDTIIVAINSFNLFINIPISSGCSFLNCF